MRRLGLWDQKHENIWKSKFVLPTEKRAWEFAEEIIGKENITDIRERALKTYGG